MLTNIWKHFGVMLTNLPQEVEDEKLTNTWKHAAVGAAIGLIWFLLCLIPGMAIGSIWHGWILIFTVGYENAQFLKRKDYCKKNNLLFIWNWPDSIIDVIAANAAFHLVYWLLAWIF